jgi:hypothetical protein
MELFGSRGATAFVAMMNTDAVGSMAGGVDEQPRRAIGPSS